VADSHGGVCILQQVTDRATDDVTTAKNHCLFAGGVYSTCLEEVHNSQRGARNEEGMATSFGQLSNIDCAETVNIFFIRNCRCDCMFGQVARKGELDKNAVHGRIIVSLGDFLKDLRLRDRFGKVDNLAEYVRLYKRGGSVRLQKRVVRDSYPYLFSGLQFHAHICALKQIRIHLIYSVEKHETHSNPIDCRLELKQCQYLRRAGFMMSVYTYPGR
jgi:hypothetical protein